MGIFSFLKKQITKPTEQQKKLYSILGYYPKNTPLYKEALTHKSVRGRRVHNERLEFLGDAVFGSVVAGLVYKIFPKENEGFLTQTRAKIVSRKTLNAIALKIKVNNILKHQVTTNQSIFGNALEALIGAVYLDKGYEFTSKYIEKKIIEPHLDIIKITKEVSSHKSKLLEWGQAHKKKIKFKMVSSYGKDHEKSYKVIVMVGHKKITEAIGGSIKKAEELAAKEAYKEIIKT